VEGVEVIRAFLGHDQVGGGMAVGLATVTGPSPVAHLRALTIDRLRTTKINFIEGNQDGQSPARGSRSRA
jgi:hypothetical protein